LLITGSIPVSPTIITAGQRAFEASEPARMSDMCRIAMTSDTVRELSIAEPDPGPLTGTPS